MDAPLRTTSGPAIERAGDLAALLSNLERGDVLFIDEIHRLPAAVEEILYPAMEDFQLDILIGQGPGAQSMRLDLPRFTLVGATTRAGLLTSPLRDRFGWIARLEYYEAEDLESIVVRAARILGVPIDDERARSLAGPGHPADRQPPRALFGTTPRSMGVAPSTRSPRRRASTSSASTSWVSTRSTGPSSRALCSRFGGGPVGLSTLAIASASRPRPSRTSTSRS